MERLNINGVPVLKVGVDYLGKTGGNSLGPGTYSTNEHTVAFALPENGDSQSLFLAKASREMTDLLERAGFNKRFMPLVKEATLLRRLGGL